MGVMAELADVVQQETALVRAGRVQRRFEISPSRRAISAAAMLPAQSGSGEQAAAGARRPRSAATLQQHHESLRMLLQTNLNVLATAHAVSEGIVRGFHEIGRRSTPQTYGASGRANAAHARLRRSAGGQPARFDGGGSAAWRTQETGATKKLERDE